MNNKAMILVGLGALIFSICIGLEMLKYPVDGLNGFHIFACCMSIGIGILLFILIFLNSLDPIKDEENPGVIV